MFFICPDPENLFLKLKEKNLTDYENLIYILSNNNYLSGSCAKRTSNDGQRIQHDSDKFESPKVDGPKFVYDKNEFEFRTKNFSEFNKNNINVLTTGCSHSMGIGLPNEFIWTSLLEEKMSNKFKRKIDTYNLSISGGNIKQSIKNILTFIETVGKPNYIFALFPNSARGVYWNKEEKKFSYTHWVDLSQKKQQESLNLFAQRYQFHYSHEANLFDIALNLHLMEALCNALNIKLIWGTWSDPDYQIWKDVNFKNIIEIDNIENYSVPVNYIDEVSNLQKSALYYKQSLLNKKNINNKPYWTCGRDGSHPGTYWQEMIAETFFKELQ